MTPLRSFAPLADARARVLILGSMPGTASLHAQQYYAHPRNAFWTLMHPLTGIAANAAYAQRCAALIDAGIALWDVLAQCERVGSLDADIVPSSTVINDFAGFFSDHADITHVFCNGTTAATLYRRRVLPTLSGRAARLPWSCLPSTSPAHAGMTLANKQRAWQVVGSALRLPATGG